MVDLTVDPWKIMWMLSLSMPTRVCLLKVNRQKRPTGIINKSRDNSRTPMQWDDSVNAGLWNSMAEG